MCKLAPGLEALRMLVTGIRYLENLVWSVARARGWAVALVMAGSCLLAEARKLSRVVRFYLVRVLHHAEGRVRVETHSVATVRALAGLALRVEDYRIDISRFKGHVAEWRYPRFYAAGPMDQGGAREEKMLEYFVSLDLAEIRAGDVVIDVASEWSLFPEMVRKEIGAKVYRQDMIYRDGLHTDFIGGSAACMPIPDCFADKLVLHNAFEHFEGSADTDFVHESWRILKPGGRLCILPLFVAEEYCILTDPLVDRRGVVWDSGARVVERPWWHNRFGRIYDADALQQRVLSPGAEFDTVVYRISNAEEVNRRAYLRLALLMEKP